MTTLPPLYVRDAHSGSWYESLAPSHLWSRCAERLVRYQLTPSEYVRNARENGMTYKAIREAMLEDIGVAPKGDGTVDYWIRVTPDPKFTPEDPCK